jgi:hypothetical protein
MRERVVRIASLAAVFGLGMMASRLPASRAENAEKAARPGTDLKVLARTVCEMRCEQRYHACVILGAVVNTSSLDQHLGRPTRGPAGEAPGTWPFESTFDDRRANPVKDPQCRPLHDECVVKDCLGEREAD